MRPSTREMAREYLLVACTWGNDEKTNDRIHRLASESLLRSLITRLSQKVSKLFRKFSTILLFNDQTFVTWSTTSLRIKNFNLEVPSRGRYIKCATFTNYIPFHISLIENVKKHLYIFQPITFISVLLRKVPSLSNLSSNKRKLQYISHIFQSCSFF